LLFEVLVTMAVLRAQVTGSEDGWTAAGLWCGPILDYGESLRHLVVLPDKVGLVSGYSERGRDGQSLPSGVTITAVC
jgi:hypothetical protein